MKIKKMIILGVLVSGIWSTIIYKIYQHMKDEPGHEMTVRKVLTVSDTPRENFELSLSYDDPFLKTKKTDLTKSTPAKKLSRPVSKTVTPVRETVIVNWKVINYQGLLYNASRKIKTASITIDGKDFFLKEGEQWDGFKILEILPDSIKVENSGAVKFIRKKK